MVIFGFGLEGSLCKGVGSRFNYANRLSGFLSGEKNDFRYFVECLYHFIYDGDDRLNEKLLLESARNLFSLLEKKNTLFSVDIYDSEENPAFSIIQVVSNNMPFIVDSIISAIKRSGVTVYNYANTILKVKRENNKFVGLLKNEEEGSSELFALFIVERLPDTTTQKLYVELKHVMSALETCVHDWLPMVSATQNVASIVLESDMENKSEVSLFLKWMIDNNFTFLGYTEQLPDKTTRLALGLHRLDQVLYKLEDINEEDINEIVIYKSTIPSIIYKFAFMHCIRVQPKCNGISYNIFGFFSSNINFHKITDIPLIRAKVQSVLEMTGFPACGHDYRFLTSILQNFSKEELFESSKDDIFNLLSLVLSLVIKRKIKLFVRRCISGHFAECTIFIPISVVSFKVIENIKNILRYKLDSVLSHSSYSELQNVGLACLHLSLKSVGEMKELSSEHIFMLEEKMTSLTTGWSSALIYYANNADIKHKYMEVYAEAFPESYRSDFSLHEALDDIEFFNEFLLNNGPKLRLYARENSIHAHLKVVSILSSDSRVLELPEILDALKKLRVKLVKHQTYDLALNNMHTIMPDNSNIRMQHFVLKNAGKAVSIERVNRCIIDTLEAVFNKRMRNDYLNSLSIMAGIPQHEIFLARAMSAYLHQIAPEYSEYVLQRTICKNTAMFKKILNIFRVKFNPDYKSENRLKDINLSINAFTKELDKLPTYLEERIFTSFLKILNAMLRTNFYTMQDYVAFKFNSTKISDDSTSPAFREIFVYSSLFEGSHIRGGKVARGGIRWSSRLGDFRTEALDLVRAQVMKNSIIVPTGSKGCFITKRSPSACTDEYIISIYMNFIRGILDLTDNIVDNQVVQQNPAVLSYDDLDPYMVVAADKGTASFSDYANQISMERGFWLADAFASGGCFGYNHKKMGITARGAFEALKRHFWEKSYFSQDKEFTVVGIGDMSGDLFGNGMLLSEHILLIAAFNHKHIFIDPSPNANISYTERNRLFHLPTSSWSDYNTNLISKGGGVFSRASKKIKISPEIQALFEITKDVISPEELIRSLLKANVDVIWNGGIGTYVKGSAEPDSLVSDHVNSTLRVNGNELRAMMFIEGGNLGCTQSARIEFAMKGGSINTDFVDNAGGVVCSDLEVNTKVLFQIIIKAGKITLDERNLFLSKTEADITKKVTGYVGTEARNISLEIFQYNNFIEKCERVVQYLRTELEKSDSEVIQKIAAFLPIKYTPSELMTKPNIALLFSCFRSLLKHEISRSTSILDDSLQIYYMKKYFLDEINEKFGDFLLQHPLRNEITVSSVSNEIIANIGCTLIVRVLDQCSLSLPVFVELYLKLNKIYNFDSVMQRIFSLDQLIDRNLFFMLVKEARNLFINGLIWAGRNYNTFMSIYGARSSSDICDVRKALMTHLGSPRDMYGMSFTIPPFDHKEMESMVSELSYLGFSGIDMEVLYLSMESQCSYDDVVKVYYEIREYLMIPLLHKEANKLSARSQRYWDRVSICNTLDSVSDSCRNAVMYCLKNKHTFVSILDNLRKGDFVISDYHNAVFDKSHFESIDIYKIALIAERINRLIAIVVGETRCLI